MRMLENSTFMVDTDLRTLDSRYENWHGHRDMYTCVFGYTDMGLDTDTSVVLSSSY